MCVFLLTRYVVQWTLTWLAVTGEGGGGRRGARGGLAVRVLRPRRDSPPCRYLGNYTNLRRRTYCPRRSWTDRESNRERRSVITSVSYYTCLPCYRRH
ncbi:hypothetical protein EVAR_77019_1 [Eumeta japonica]|uniref:Secreted protein n=1 Tax=Eumeta variegata TaxID=151549 RepID=A0A4C1SFN8_EUMVA|nr:hypothetical protein EVAR_77019_1 [Eumeta japonica]